MSLTDTLIANLGLSTSDREGSDITFNGYSSWDPIYDLNTAVRGTPNPPLSSTGPQYVTVTRSEKVWVPPTIGRVGSPSIPATPTQTIHNKSLGWNSWARSVNPLVIGSFFQFTCNLSEGLCLGIGPSDHLGGLITTFSHALVVDPAGVHVYENGAKLATIKNRYTEAANIKIFLQADLVVVYVVTTGTETLVITSEYPYSPKEAYVYGYIYSSDDVVCSAEYRAGTVQYGSI